jgi:TonB family protein
MQAHGTAIIRLDLAPQGRLVSATVVTSTDNWWLDHAALDAVREARFEPELRNCRNVGGSYLVEVDFPENNE